MRYRKPTNYKEKLSRFQQSTYFDQPEEWYGKWQERLPNKDSIFLEIGCGKGGFLIAHAQKYPQRNFIGIERNEALLIEALEQVEELQLNNILFLGHNATFLDRVFQKDDIKQIYLNFSDPWPKNRNKKRRLTSRNFLEKYKKVMIEKGEISFKTDNRKLFEFTLIELSQAGCLLQEVDLDLHKNPLHEDEDKYITTEYEKRFISMDMPIYALKAII